MSLDFPTDGVVETRRVTLFLLGAFGVAWATAAVIYATGGLVDSPSLPGLPLSLAGALLPTTYMFAPAVGVVLARGLTGEGWANSGLRPRVRASLRTYALAWFVPAALTVVGAAVFFALFPAAFDFDLAAFGEVLQGAAAPGVPVDPVAVAVAQVAVAVTFAPLFNALFALGEELGWRAYLLPKLAPLGRRRATLLVGVVWGVWHWPIVAMGYNYGFDYPGAPWTGLLAMCWFTVVTGVFLAWVTVRSKSVWPAALGHGAINAIAAVGVLFAAGPTNPLLGPTPLGVVGGVGWALLALWLLVRSQAFVPSA